MSQTQETQYKFNKRKMLDLLINDCNELQLFYRNTGKGYRLYRISPKRSTDYLGASYFTGKIDEALAFMQGYCKHKWGDPYEKVSQ